MYCVFCNSEGSTVQNCLYLLRFLQFGALNRAKYNIFTGLFAIRTARTNAKQHIFTELFVIRGAQKCKINYMYCAFCNSDNSNVFWGPNLQDTRLFVDLNAFWGSKSIGYQAFYRFKCVLGVQIYRMPCFLSIQMRFWVPTLQDTRLFID